MRLVKALILGLLLMASPAWGADAPPTSAPQPQQQNTISISRRDQLMMNRGANMNAAKPFLEAIEQIDAELAKMDAETKGVPPAKVTEKR